MGAPSKAGDPIKGVKARYQLAVLKEIEDDLEKMIFIECFRLFTVLCTSFPPPYISFESMQDDLSY